MQKVTLNFERDKIYDLKNSIIFRNKLEELFSRYELKIDSSSFIFDLLNGKVNFNVNGDFNKVRKEIEIPLLNFYRGIETDRQDNIKIIEGYKNEDKTPDKKFDIYIKARKKELISRNYELKGSTEMAILLNEQAIDLYEQILDKKIKNYYE